MAKNSRLLKAISDPEIYPFINKQALVRSDAFLQLIDSAIRQYREDRNWDTLRKLCLVFRQSKYFLVLTTYIADFANLDIRFKGASGLHFIPRKDEYRKPLHAHFDVYLADVALHKNLSTIRSNQETNAQKKRGLKGGDAMNRRLPGSFENG